MTNTNNGKSDAIGGYFMGYNLTNSPKVVIGTYPKTSSTNLSTEESLRLIESVNRRMNTHQDIILILVVGLTLLKVLDHLFSDTRYKSKSANKR